jgi:hypothetical protein
MKLLRLPLCLLASAWLFFSCDRGEQATKQDSSPISDPLFRLLDPESTGITFSNTIEEDLNLNVLMYEYLYNGGGVAVGDLNQDGLDDIYFSANVGQNHLYLNEGELKFKDITQASGATGRPGPWKTGVVLVDINGDGKLDIYLCHSGALMPEKRKNELFVNQGNNADGIPQFKEMAEEYGIASESTTTSAAFFDFDLDGDLDLFLLNHNIKSTENHDVTRTISLLKEKHEAGSQLFENKGGTFVEVTENAGISSSSLSYGLGVSVADINDDGWPDIYIGNDYSMPDYLYINQQDGTFKDEIGSMLDHMAHFSMGNDIADINNDGLLDIFTLDMLPEDNARQKLLLSPDNFELFQLNLDRGFHHQYMRNMLHVNAGDGTFQEIGQLAGISNTDWSWAGLFLDLDLDGWKDLFVTNGYLRDYNNQDFLKYMDNYVRTSGGQLKREDLLTLVKSMSSSNLKNYSFRNRGDLTFENVSATWGINENGNSNGAAYADLDNDGDLDLIINNINAPAFIYENLAVQRDKGNFVRIQLKGEGQNTLGQGAKVSVFSEGKLQVQEQNIYRGFQSSVSPVLVFGLGTSVKADSILVNWPGGKVSRLLDVTANETQVISQQEAAKGQKPKPAKLAGLLTAAGNIPLPKSNAVNDFKRQPLLNFEISGNGKAMVVGDFDGDGNPDIFLGGGAGVSGRLHFGKRDGKFDSADSTAFVSAALAEDSDAISLDANGDGFEDLLVASGGMHQFNVGDEHLQARLYINDGKGKLTLSLQALPREAFPVGALTAMDFNGDGILDVFVGGRVIPGQYPTSPGARVWIGDGKGGYTDQTDTFAPDFKNLGMITDSGLVDLDGDGVEELIIVGDAMPVTIFAKSSTSWKNVTSEYFDTPQVGFWSDLLIGDWNKDGKPELFIGNHGRNSQLFASDREPLELLYKDFDSNGSTDAIMGYYIQGEKYPSASRDEILGQVLFLKKRYLDFKSFSGVKMDDLFTSEERKDSKSIAVNNLSTSYFVLSSDGKFQSKELPLEAQFSPVYAAASVDVNGDGHLDLIFGGNLFDAKLKFGRYDANHGSVFLGDGAGNFNEMTSDQSGLSIKGELRKIEVIGNQILFSIKDQGIQQFTYHLSND